MTWSLHRVSLASHDLRAAATFFGTHVGLGPARHIDERTIAFGAGSRGLRVHKPERQLTARDGKLAGTAGARHVAIDVADLQRVAQKLDRASLPHVEAGRGDFDGPALYTLDPSHNVVAFCQAGARGEPPRAAHPWGLHHVNLEAHDVRETTAFYVEIGGLAEGQWRAPASRGDFSIDRSQLAVLSLGEHNRGLHIIKVDPGFAHRNRFPHNPSIGGHPAFFVQDVTAVKARLESAGILVSDAGVYAMAGMHQIYVFDPTTNMVEVNQYV